MKPYGLRGDVFNNPGKYDLPEMSNKPIKGGYRILGLYKTKREYMYVPSTYPFPRKDMIEDYKLFIPRNWGMGNLNDVPSKIEVAKPGDACTETFVQMGPFATLKEAENALSYFKTKFFRAMVNIRKQDQGSSKAVYHYVPIQDFSKEWDDKMLYDKYKLLKKEIEFIEKNISPME